MKKCPFCKAEIEDNARFCLYCMKPLKEKSVIPPVQKKARWWLIPPVSILLLGLLVFLLVSPGENTALPTASTGEESTADTQWEEPQTSEPTQNTPQTTPPLTTEPKTTEPKTTEPKKTEPEVTEPEVTEPEVTEPEVTEPEKTEPEATAPEETAPIEPEPENQKSQVAYSYRAARAGDEFNANYQNSGNDIVITGIEQEHASSIYRIPATIDGKRVIAIMANAFYGSNAKQVYVPTSVKTIWRNAFNGCALTDLYFTHNIYIESIPDGITIHCPQTCQNRTYSSYSSMAANYGFTWKEWNG